MSKIFIDRPIFAWVIAIIIMLMGIGAIVQIPSQCWRPAWKGHLQI